MIRCPYAFRWRSERRLRALRSILTLICRRDLSWPAEWLQPWPVPFLGIQCPGSVVSFSVSILDLRLRSIGSLARLSANGLTPVEDWLAVPDHHRRLRPHAPVTSRMPPRPAPLVHWSIWPNLSRETCRGFRVSGPWIGSGLDVGADAASGAIRKTAR